MRVKTDAMRQEILRAAAVIFHERGFHETTVAHVAAEMGSSKATIYNYFTSKAELYAEVLLTLGGPATDTLFGHFQEKGSFAERLKQFSRAYILLHARPGVVSTRRLMIVEIGRSDLGKRLSKGLRTNFWPRIAEVIQAAQANGDIRAGDPVLIARHLRALLDGDLPARLLVGDVEACTPAEIEESADAAVGVFLAAYGSGA